MLNEIEFIGKRHIILDKSFETIIFNRLGDHWQIHMISKVGGGFSYIEHGDEKAFEIYSNRMRSYGFQQFPIIVE